MKKENFVKLIEGIREAYCKDEKVSDLFFELYGEYTPMFNGSLIDVIINVLESEFNTEDVGWWLFDSQGVEGKVKEGALLDKDNTPIDVSTPEKLYDYLMEEK